MDCYVHPDQPAVGACVACGHFVCDHCRVNVGGKIHCKTCVERGAAAPPPPYSGGPRPAGAPIGAGGAGDWKRSRRDRVFAGVCGGIAPEMNLEPSLARVLFVVATIFTGVVPGIVTYCVLWAVLPEE